MKIDSYRIGMDSARTFSSSSTRKLSFEGSLRDNFGAFSNNQYLETDVNSKKENNSSPGATLDDLVESMRTAGNSRLNQISHTDNSKEINNARQKFILYLWQIFFGKDRSDELAKEFGFNASDSTDIQKPYTNLPAVQVISLKGVRETYYEESEGLSFVSNGSVTTEDGRQIDFSLDINMSRSFSNYYREEGIPLANLCDPLVLNFNGEFAELTDQKFYFDLDNDGKTDEISQLADGNGYLALDLDNDGIINNGSELFGTSSGDGFLDLAQYDLDRNGWIDENDAIYDKLKIWVRSSDGENSLYSLKEKNVGAIYLGSANTNYTLRGESGNINGVIRRTGTFLFEDGTGVGTISHLDIAN